MGWGWGVGYLFLKTLGNLGQPRSNLDKIGNLWVL
jgi:hypothetical protein